MNAAVEALSGQLVELLAKPVDPRTVEVRHSALKKIEQSPLHYLHAVQDETEETLSMRLGSGAHAILLGKPWKEWNRPAKKGAGRAPRQGEQWDDFVKENPDTVIMTPPELAHARGMAEAVQRNPLAMRVLADTTREQTIHWTLDGRACRSTPDAYSRLHVVEFKTAQSAEPRRFLKTAFWERYHSQLAMYCDAIRAVGLGDPDEAYIVAVESSPPYAVSVLKLTDRALDHGRTLYRQWFARLLECEAANEWPGYSTDVLSFDVE